MQLENVNLNNRIFVGDKYLYMTANPESVKEENIRSDLYRAEWQRNCKFLRYKIFL